MKEYKQRTCIICGKEFIPNYYNEKYCSLECRKKGHYKAYKKWATSRSVKERKKRLITITCEICGKEFTIENYVGCGNRKYCSEKCVEKAKYKSKRRKFDKLSPEEKAKRRKMNRDRVAKYRENHPEYNYKHQQYEDYREMKSRLFYEERDFIDSEIEDLYYSQENLKDF